MRGGYLLKKNNELLAIFILIPMLIFTLLVTLNTQTSQVNNGAKDVIYKYFDYKNNKDFDSLSKLFLSQNTQHEIKSSMNNIESISLININEENSKSIMDIYLKNSKGIKSENVKIYSVSYRIQYNKGLSYKNGIYESWYFLTRRNESSKWLIDIHDV